MQVQTLLLIASCALVTGKKYSVTLDPADKFNVAWSFEEITPDSYITFTVSVLKQINTRAGSSQDIYECSGNQVLKKRSPDWPSDNNFKLLI